jgi:hypothetical protein
MYEYLTTGGKYSAIKRCSTIAIRNVYQKGQADPGNQLSVRWSKYNGDIHCNVLDLGTF